MYIKSIVLDGFKSYAQRTEITGFDPLFNAITGLNGSGKSNILDSICFVLGISNLSHVRATNLQELVYKNGQAGITKATVSITFDNSDASQCPFGYSQYEEIVVTRQVMVGGRNKYLVNGTAASNQKVADLFKSVSLNINNPHFLIMQGRITKVLNMKPPEILSMIEEAAGTRLYESKRENAEKMIEKKETKLREIDALIEEETGPKLERLKKERDSYIEYQKILREIEHLNKLYIAWQFVCADRDRKTFQEELVKIQELIQSLQNRCATISAEVKVLDKEIEELERQMQGDQTEILEELEKELHERQQEDAVASSRSDGVSNEVKSQGRKLKELEKNVANDQAVLVKKQQELVENTSSNASTVKAREDAKTAFALAQKRFQAESAGLASNDDGEDATLNDQLIAAKNSISKAETDTKNAQMVIKHSEEEIKKRKSELKKSSADYERDKASMDNITNQINRLEADLKKTNYEPGSIEKLRDERSSLEKEIHKLREHNNAFSDRFPQLQFDYVDPVKNFDRRKVCGPVAKLIALKDPAAAMALEVVAGGKLYNIVVDDDVTAQQLLDKGQLKRKYTILPLNKMAASALEKSVIQHAKSLVGKDNVNMALDLVGYDPHVEAAMKHVFGNTFVCTTSDCAKRVTFDKQIMKRSVTLEGDSFDPAGTLTGGSRPQSSGILGRLTEMNSTAELSDKQQRLADVDEEISKLKKVFDLYSKLEQQREMKRRELEMMRGKLQQTTHGAQLEHIKNLEDTINQQEKVIESSSSIKETATKKVTELESLIKNAKGIREQRLKQIEQDMAKAKKDIENFEQKFAKRDKESETLKLEVEELQKEVEACLAQIDQLRKGLQDLETRATECKAKCKETKASVAECSAKVKAHKDEMLARNREITDKVNQQKRLKQEYTESTLKLEELAHDIESKKSAGRNATKQLDNLVAKHEWIQEEKQFFGLPSTAYDFTANDPKETSRQINKLQEKRSGLEQSVNMRAMTMLDQAQAQHNDMLRKRRILMHDKEKMAATIIELDEKKNTAVEKAYRQVNKDFTSIFSMLLPGATAKLAPPGGHTCLDGLEVKVGFGDVWKDSLTELSGGQRSLVALSLILAMLLFKPAPLYILDEVDAALDLSHTQNIGQMLRTHFSHSQFIVVSLKDGMYANANVLFRTRFVDGVSMISRYTQTQQKKALAPRNDNINQAADLATKDESQVAKAKKMRS